MWNFVNVSRGNTQGESEVRLNQQQRRGQPALQANNLQASIVYPEEDAYYLTLFADVRSVKFLRLHCTVCDAHIGCPNDINLIHCHFILRVLMCKPCLLNYGNGYFSRDATGKDICCRWCGTIPGPLHQCVKCPNGFCEKCITHNFGPSYVEEIKRSQGWTCFVCNISSLWELRAICWALKSYVKLRSKNEVKSMPADESLCCQKTQGSNMQTVPTTSSQPVPVGIVTAHYTQPLSVNQNTPSLATTTNSSNLCYSMVSGQAINAGLLTPSQSFSSQSYVSMQQPAHPMPAGQFSHAAENRSNTVNISNVQQLTYLTTVRSHHTTESSNINVPSQSSNQVCAVPQMTHNVVTPPAFVIPAPPAYSGNQVAQAGFGSPAQYNSSLGAYQMVVPHAQGSVVTSNYSAEARPSAQTVSDNSTKSNVGFSKYYTQMYVPPQPQQAIKAASDNSCAKEHIEPGGSSSSVKSTNVSTENRNNANVTSESQSRPSNTSSSSNKGKEEEDVVCLDTETSNKTEKNTVSVPRLRVNPNILQSYLNRKSYVTKPGAPQSKPQWNSPTCTNVVSTRVQEVVVTSTVLSGTISTASPSLAKDGNIPHTEGSGPQRTSVVNPQKQSAIVKPTPADVSKRGEVTSNESITSTLDVPSASKESCDYSMPSSTNANTNQHSSFITSSAAIDIKNHFATCSKFLKGGLLEAVVLEKLFTDEMLKNNEAGMRKYAHVFHNVIGKCCKGLFDLGGNLQKMMGSWKKEMARNQSSAAVISSVPYTSSNSNFQKQILQLSASRTARQNQCTANSETPVSADMSLDLLCESDGEAPNNEQDPLQTTDDQISSVETSKNKSTKTAPQNRHASSSSLLESLLASDSEGQAAHENVEPSELARNLTLKLLLYGNDTKKSTTEASVSHDAKRTNIETMPLPASEATEADHHPSEKPPYTKQASGTKRNRKMRREVTKEVNKQPEVPIKVFKLDPNSQNVHQDQNTETSDARVECTSPSTSTNSWAVEFNKFIQDSGERDINATLDAYLKTQRRNLARRKVYTNTSTRKRGLTETDHELLKQFKIKPCYVLLTRSDIC